MLCKSCDESGQLGANIVFLRAYALADPFNRVWIVYPFNLFIRFLFFFLTCNVAVGHVPRRSQGLANAGQLGRPPVHPYRRTSELG